MQERLVTVLTRRSFITALIASTITPRAISGQTPEASPIACRDLDTYIEAVYRAAEPDASITEIGIARAAWGGPDALRQLSLAELHTAQFYYQEWAKNLAATPEREIPNGLQDMHHLSIRRIELRADFVSAYLVDDRKAAERIVEEMWDVEEQAYEIGLAGVEQCGTAWIDVFGEPWDPSSDATPVATPHN